MEMNKYLIAALYVMAGCVAAVPLKAQGNAEPLRGERCRLVLTATVKMAVGYAESEHAEAICLDAVAGYAGAPVPADSGRTFAADCNQADKRKCIYFTSHKIRAPGRN